MANYGVALWFAILSVSPAICHEHADGDTDHSHGYGFFSTSPHLVPTCSSEADLAPSSRHYHLVLFGIEITILPGCAALETGTLPDAHDSVLTWTGDLGAGPVADAENPPSPDFDLPAPAEKRPAAAISQDSFLVTDLPSSPCTPARALRSGVQLI